MVDKKRFGLLKYSDIPRMLKERGKDYVDGYTYGLLQFKVITMEELIELRGEF